MPKMIEFRRIAAKHGETADLERDFEQSQNLLPEAA